jgi:hypothetical protein
MQSRAQLPRCHEDADEATLLATFAVAALTAPPQARPKARRRPWVSVSRVLLWWEGLGRAEEIVLLECSERVFGVRYGARGEP